MNTHLIHSFSDFDPATIRLRKPIVCDDRTIVRLKKSIFLESGIHYVAYKPLMDVYNFAIVSLIENERIKGEFEKIEAIEDAIVSRLQTSHGILIEDRVKFSVINKEKKTLRMKNKASDIQVYSKGAVSQDLKCIYPYDRVKVILRIDHIWISKHSYGCNAYVIQILSLEDIHANPSVLSISKEEEESLEDDVSIEHSARFRKMVAVGIPIAAVKQKMLMEGYTNETVYRFFAKSKASYPVAVTTTATTATTATTIKPPPGPPPPPPRPPPPPPQMFGIPARPAGGVNMHQIFETIKNGAYNLKKAIVQQPRMPPKIAGVDTSKRVPSLDEIIQARNKLKSPKVVYHGYTIRSIEKQQ